MRHPRPTLRLARHRGGDGTSQHRRRLPRRGRKASAMKPRAAEPIAPVIGYERLRVIGEGQNCLAARARSDIDQPGRHLARPPETHHVVQRRCLHDGVAVR